MKRISLCMIVKDEQDNLAACLDSVRAHVDEIIIVDTGSTDRTREIAVSRGASVFQFDRNNHPEAFYLDDEETCRAFAGPAPYSGEWTLGDFAAARNESFARATGDYVVWMDADDVLEQPERLREVVGDMEAQGVGVGFCAYNYAQDHAGRVYYRQWRERVFRRGDASWVGPVHEVLIPKTTKPPRQYPFPTWSHKRKHDRRATPHRNYKILLRQVWQIKTANPSAPLDPRILFYLGQEARFVDAPRALGFYEEYLRTSGWGEERAAAHNAIGNMLELGMLGLPPDEAYAKANREYATAAAEMPSNPDGLFGLARIAYLRNRYADCIGYTERAFALGHNDSMLGANPMDRLYRPHVFYNHALSQLGRIEDAIKSCEAALAVNPDDPGVPGGKPGMLKNNLAVYRAELAKRAAAAEPGEKATAIFGVNDDIESPPPPIPTDAMVIWSVQLWKQLIAANDLERASMFLGALPGPVRAHVAWSKMDVSTVQRRERAGWVMDSAPAATIDPPTNQQWDVVFYLGPAPEPWDPTTPETTGLGGSETAAIAMARELAKLGRKVVVYAEADGEWDGVRYVHHRHFKGAVCDVFIASRAPWAIELFGPVHAAVKLLWVHDIHCGPMTTAMERYLLKFDRVLCLSRWHKDFFLGCYPTLDPSRVVVTRNGIDPTRFRGSRGWPTRKNRMVFSSSPNRGLAYLIPNFRAIRARVPDAELHIYYGFDTWETMARAGNDHAQLAEIQRYKDLIEQASRDGGVFFHGKQPQHVLADAFLEAKVWGYLTEFTETSCISAMEAMAAGCVPVYNPRAALAETVRHGVRIEEGPSSGPEFVEACVRVMQDDVYRGGIARAAREYAIGSLGWDEVARSWVALFDNLKDALAKNPVPPWRPMPPPVAARP